MDEPDAVAAVIRHLPAEAARLVAVEILLSEPESLGDDVLESCLYLMRDRLQGTKGDAWGTRPGERAQPGSPQDDDAAKKASRSGAAREC